MNDKNKNLIIKNISDKNQWVKLLDKFEDANIYQTWSYAEIVQSEKIIEHIAIYENDNLLAVALVRIKSVPLFKRGVAYIFRGPLWRLRENEQKLENFYKVVGILRSYYVKKRKYLLKLRPAIFNDTVDYLNIDFQLYFDPGIDNVIYKSFVLYLFDGLETIRKNFKQKWRNCLNQAEKNNIEVVSGNSRELYDLFIDLYDQMLKRKKFKEYVDVRKTGDMNDKLIDKFKLQTFIAYKDNTPVSALVGSAMGDTGIYLFGATNELGMKHKAAYLLQWEMIKWLKSIGIKRYDLGGIDPINNPGVYKFKAGVSKKEITDFGSFETSDSKILKRIYDFIHFVKMKLMIFLSMYKYIVETGMYIEQF